MQMYASQDVTEKSFFSFFYHNTIICVLNALIH